MITINENKTGYSITPNQLNAITNTEGIMEILGEKGSGKTMVLVLRYLYLFNALGINSTSILFLNKSKRKAQNIKRQIRKSTFKTIDLRYITSFDAICEKILREDIHLLNHSKGFKVLQRADQIKILQQIYWELGIKSSRIPYEEALEHIVNTKRNLGYLIDTFSIGFSGKNNFLDKILNKYLEKQRSAHSLDKNDLLNLTQYLFNNFPKVLLKWQTKLLYIQVDDTQNYTKDQIELIVNLSEGHNNLCLADDAGLSNDDYSENELEILRYFEHIYPDAPIIKLKKENWEINLYQENKLGKTDSINSLDYQMDLLKNGFDHNNQRFKINSIITHPIWGDGEILEINLKKGVYSVHFSNLNKIKLIRIDYGGIQNSQ